MARKKKKCPGCGKEIDGRAKTCRSCRYGQASPGPPVLAWRYDCGCRTITYSFDPHHRGHPERRAIRATCGYDLETATKVIYTEGKLHDYCPECGLAAESHAGERRDEMFYVALCSSKS